MTDRKDATVASLLVGAVVLCTAAGAQTGNIQNAAITTTTTNVSDKTMSRPYGSHLEPILQKINATTDQRQKITTIVQNFRPKIEPLRQEYRVKSQQFLQLIVTGQP